MRISQSSLNDFPLTAVNHHGHSCHYIIARNRQINTRASDAPGDPPLPITTWDGSLFVPGTALAVPASRRAELALRSVEGLDAVAGSGATAPAFAGATGFFSTANPIIRAFESNAGRGLAGHITQLSYDYFDSTWETKRGSRGPQWLKVNMAFAPIHDIAPGIDAHGMNRAPVYNMGEIINDSVAGDFYETNYSDATDTVYKASPGEDSQWIRKSTLDPPE